MSSSIPLIINNPSSMRMYGDKSISPKYFEEFLQKAKKSRKRELKDAAKSALEDLSSDRLRIRSGLHKGGWGYKKSGKNADPRAHITFRRQNSGDHHLRFGSKGKVIQITSGK